MNIFAGSADHQRLKPIGELGGPRRLPTSRLSIAMFAMAMVVAFGLKAVKPEAVNLIF